MKAHATFARASAAAVLWACMDTAIRACPICFQVEDARTVSGVRAAVIVLMSVTGVVLGGFAFFAARVVRRAGATAAPRHLGNSAFAKALADKPESRNP